MREILFRGKRVDNGKWVEGYLSFVYIDVPEKARIYSPAKVRSFDVITETVGQYTGLKDKNGVRIFEGDILRRILRNAAETEYIYTVNWCKECAMFVLPCITYEPGETDFTVFYSDELEVIGNIHDNPEMVKGDA